MMDKTKLQIQFEKETPTIQKVGAIEYLQTFVSWLHFQIKKEKPTCEWTFYTDYYETGCSNQMEEEDYEPIQPIYCPFCGNKININYNE